MQDQIFIWGMPGAGKTTIGFQLADKLGYPFIDLDQEIIKANATSITDIFSQQGEDYFREIEAEFLRKMVRKNQSMVLATGGGTPCFHQNASFMLARGRCVFLDVPLYTIRERLAKQGQTTRPLLQDYTEDELLVRLQKTMDSRRQFYMKAPVVLSGDLTIERLLKELSA